MFKVKPLVLFGLFGLAIVIRLAATWIWSFDGLYGQDAFAYYDQATAIAHGLPAGSLPPQDFFWPNGYPVLAAVAMWLLGETARTAQFVNVFCGAALAPLTYGLSRALFPEIGTRAGVWSGLIVAVAGQPVLSSVVIMADVSALFWAALAAWLLVRTWPVGVDPVSEPAGGHLQRGYLLLAGLMLGLAVVTRWIYALLALPFAAYALIQTRRSRTWRFLLIPVLGGLGVLMPQVWLSLGRPDSLLHSWLLNWRITNAFGRQFAHVDGHYTYTLPVALYYLQPLAHPNYMVPVLGLAALWGGWHLWRERAWGPLMLMGGWLGVAYLFLAGIPYENFRFGLTLYLPAVLLAGVGVEILRTQPPIFVMNRLSPRMDRRIWEWGVHTVFGVCLLSMGLWMVRSVGQFLSAQNQSKAMVREIESMLPADATVLAFGLTLTLQHYTELNVVEFYSLDEEMLDAATTTSSPIYLLLDLGNVAQQWQDRPPSRNYRWLRAHRALTPVAEFPPYSLFQISDWVGVNEKSQVDDLTMAGETLPGRQTP